MTKEQHIPVKIHLTTTIRLDGEEETYELKLFGRRYRKGDTVYLLYDEVQEEGIVHTVVKIGKQEVAINRSGIVKMRMRFKQSEELMGSHESPFGTIVLTTKTIEMTHIENQESKDGSFSLQYALSMQGAESGHHHMQLEYKEDALNNEYR